MIEAWKLKTSEPSDWTFDSARKRKEEIDIKQAFLI
jgi:hypothetical protein